MQPITHMLVLIMSLPVICVCDWRTEPGGSSARYLGQEPPGTIPVVFAPDVITRNHEAQNCLTITPDGREVYWGLWYSERRINKILFSKCEDNTWSEPQFLFASADGDYNDDAPFLSPDGRRLYFISRRPSYEGDTTRAETIS